MEVLLADGIFPGSFWWLDFFLRIHCINIGPYVLAMAFIILSSLSSYCHFIVCHKHSKIILGDIHPGTVTWDASLTSQPIFSMFCGCQGLHTVHICHCYHAEDMLSRLLVLIDKEFCILQLHISTKEQIITEFIRQVQRRIHNPVKYLRWNFLQKYLTAFQFFHTLQKAFVVHLIVFIAST